MTPAWIVPALDEAEDCHPSFALRLELSPVEEFTFELGEEALAHRIVVGIPHRSHGWSDTGFLASQAKGNGGVLRSLIGVMDHVEGTPLRERHIEGIEHKLGLQTVAHRPADDPTREGIQHDSQIGGSRTRTEHK